MRTSRAIPGWAGSGGYPATRPPLRRGPRGGGARAAGWWSTSGAAARASRVAVLPLGYADGLPRRASGRAFAAIRGRRVPLVGAISMDIAIADVTELPEVAVGDVAVLLGRAAGGASISVAEYGAWA